MHEIDVFCSPPPTSNVLHSAQVFFALWCLSAIWFTVLVVYKREMHNWFRLPCTLSSANVVHAWAKSQQQILSMNVLSLVHIVRKLKVSCYNLSLCKLSRVQLDHLFNGDRLHMLLIHELLFLIRWYSIVNACRTCCLDMNSWVTQRRLL